MATTTHKKRTALYRMWERNPNCHWCGRVTVLIMRRKFHNQGLEMVRIRDDEATIDHLRTRLNPDRRAAADGSKRWVLACRECNHRRGEEEYSALPLVQKHLRSSHGLTERLRVPEADPCHGQVAPVASAEAADIY